MATQSQQATASPGSRTITGAQALVEALRAQGVEVIFGYPGAATIPIHDALTDSGIRHILTRHEQGAAHAADGYARATGRVGVCLATSGPGALNLVTGIATAHMDSVPIVAITGQVATTKLGTDAFQEADTTGVTMPIVKHSFLVKHVSELAQAVSDAFVIASEGRPGPVVIDLPVDVSLADVESAGTRRRPQRQTNTSRSWDVARVGEAVRMIDSSQKPLICAGGGVVAGSGSSALAALAEKTGIPVAYTLMGKGAFPDSHPLNVGMLGMHGSALANRAAQRCDLFIAVGMRFSDRATGRASGFAPGARVVHIDIDPAEMGKMRRPEVPIVCDAGTALGALADGVRTARRGEWLRELEQWRHGHRVPRADSDGRIAPQEVFDALNRVTRGDAIITTDVGQHQMWAAQMCTVNHPRRFISSGGLGTMGFGLPAAIGAQIAFPERHVFVVAGDGSILMNSQELMTAVENRLPLKILIFNNGYLGMVRQWQQLFYDRRYAATDISAQPDFAALASAYGAVGLRARTSGEIEPAMLAAMHVSNRPCVIDFHIVREACVTPMIPTGGTVDDMIMEPD